MKKCLILSDGPVPTPEHKKVEGGGLRCWGLARGIKQSNSEIDVTLAYNESYTSKEGQFTNKFEDISIITWNLDSIPELVKEFDTVLVSYCMGQLSVEVARAVTPQQQLILDCYVPIYVEVSARNSQNIEDEYFAFNSDTTRWAEVLKRGDIFLCASEPQKKFYQGVLAALGRINPVTYGEELIRIVPYGIYREKPVSTEKPIQKIIGKGHAKYKKILWFGGIYPWFDLRDLIEATKRINDTVPTKLVIVGAKNPFNNHPDFVSKYDELITYVHDNNLESYVIFQDWVKFEERANWYLDCDLVVVVNKLGDENALAWRTRLVDFVWADLPIITNGGDPLGELLIEHNAAAKYTSTTAEGLAEEIKGILANPEKIAHLKKNISKIRPLLYWDTVTAEVANDVVVHTRAKDLDTIGLFDINHGVHGYGNNRLIKIAKKIKKIPAYAKKHGYRNAYYAIKGVGIKKLKRFTHATDAGPRLVFVSHQLDMSGAPFVLMDMAKEVKESAKHIDTAFYTYLPMHTQNVTRLNKSGIKPSVIFDKNVAPDFNKGDVVVLNTVAHSEPVKEKIFSSLESGDLKCLLWYVHEDQPELQFRPDEKNRIKTLILSGKLKFFIAAKKMQTNYKNYFGVEKGIEFVTYRHIVDNKYHNKRKKADFEDKLSFSLPGTVGDGRKGQLPVFYAFVEFYNNNYLKSPESYRDFELVYVGKHDDFLSRQLENHSSSLGKRFKFHGRVTNDECMQVVSKSNITICYSMRECLPLFVFEGMITGHPILRNDSSGIDEQLIDGENGFLLDSKDYNQLLQTIERILNKKKTSNRKLEEMSAASYQIAVAQEKNSYLPALKEHVEYLESRSK